MDRSVELPVSLPGLRAERANTMFVKILDGEIGPGFQYSDDAGLGALAMGDGKDATLKRFSVWAALKIAPDDPSLIRLAIPVLSDGLKHYQEMVRYESAVGLGELGEAAKPAAAALNKALKDESPQVREAAAEALKKISG